MRKTKRKKVEGIFDSSKNVFTSAEKTAKESVDVLVESPHCSKVASYVKNDDTFSKKTFFGVGISSFQNFVLPKSLNLSSGSIVVAHNSSFDDTSLCSDVTGGDVTFTDDIVSTPSYPNILRHKRNDLKKHSNLGSPIKTLTFSPSKFLNTSTGEVIEKLDTSKELSMSHCVSDTEDSGIVLPDSTMNEIVSGIPLTSTPSSKSRRKSTQHVFEIHSENSNCSSSSPIENKDFSETPLVRKFIRNSAPRTPTPFKCPSEGQIFLRTKIKNSVKQGNLSASSSPATGYHRKEMVGCKVLSRKMKKKAVKLEPIGNFRRTLFSDNNTICKIEPGLLELSHLNANDNVFSSVKQESVGKTCHFPKKNGTISTKLNKTWVSVACGQTYDQKMMTAAAKKYMAND